MDWKPLDEVVYDIVRDNASGRDYSEKDEEDADEVVYDIDADWSIVE